MNSAEFDQHVEAEDSIVDALDLPASRRPRLGVTRQSIIKVWCGWRNAWSGAWIQLGPRLLHHHPLERPQPGCRQRSSQPAAIRQKPSPEAENQKPRTRSLGSR
jgi:hypothetical protein